MAMEDDVAHLDDFVNEAEVNFEPVARNPIKELASPLKMVYQRMVGEQSNTARSGVPTPHGVNQRGRPSMRSSIGTSGSMYQVGTVKQSSPERATVGKRSSIASPYASFVGTLADISPSRQSIRYPHGKGIRTSPMRTSKVAQAPLAQKQKPLAASVRPLHHYNYIAAPVLQGVASKASSIVISDMVEDFSETETECSSSIGRKRSSVYETEGHVIIGEPPPPFNMYQSRQIRSSQVIAKPPQRVSTTIKPPWDDSFVGANSLGGIRRPAQARTKPAHLRADAPTTGQRHGIHALTRRKISVSEDQSTAALVQNIRDAAQFFLSLARGSGAVFNSLSTTNATSLLIGAFKTSTKTLKKARNIPKDIPDLIRKTSLHLGLTEVAMEWATASLDTPTLTELSAPSVPKVSDIRSDTAADRIWSGALSDTKARISPQLPAFLGISTVDTVSSPGAQAPVKLDSPLYSLSNGSAVGDWFSARLEQIKHEVLAKEQRRASRNYFPTFSGESSTSPGSGSQRVSPFTSTRMDIRMEDAFGQAGSVSNTPHVSLRHLPTGSTVYYSPVSPRAPLFDGSTPPNPGKDGNSPPAGTPPFVATLVTPQAASPSKIVAGIVMEQTNVLVPLATSEAGRTSPGKDSGGSPPTESKGKFQASSNKVLQADTKGSQERSDEVIAKVPLATEVPVAEGPRLPEEPAAQEARIQNGSGASIAPVKPKRIIEPEVKQEMTDLQYMKLAEFAHLEAPSMLGPLDTVWAKYSANPQTVWETIEKRFPGSKSRYTADVEALARERLAERSRLRGVLNLPPPSQTPDSQALTDALSSGTIEHLLQRSSLEKLPDWFPSPVDAEVVAHSGTYEVPIAIPAPDDPGELRQAGDVSESERIWLNWIGPEQKLSDHLPPLASLHDATQAILCLSPNKQGILQYITALKKAHAGLVVAFGVLCVLLGAETKWGSAIEVVTDKDLCSKLVLLSSQPIEEDVPAPTSETTGDEAVRFGPMLKAAQKELRVFTNPQSHGAEGDIPAAIATLLHPVPNQNTPSTNIPTRVKRSNFNTAVRLLNKRPDIRAEVRALRLKISEGGGRGERHVDMPLVALIVIVEWQLAYLTNHIVRRMIESKQVDDLTPLLSASLA